MKPERFIVRFEDGDCFELSEAEASHPMFRHGLQMARLEVIGMPNLRYMDEVVAITVGLAVGRNFPLPKNERISEEQIHNALQPVAKPSSVREGVAQILLQGIREDMVQCFNCEQPIESMHPFCMYCGKHNLLFNEQSAIVRHWGKNLAAVQAESCTAEFHGELKESDILKARYCFLCGKML